MSDELIESDFDQEAETEEIEDFFLLDKDQWDSGDYFGADKI